VSFRTYHEVTGEDRSQLASQVGALRELVSARLHTVARVIAVMSGKGGVGKSYVTALLAREAAMTGAVGVLDADLRGPTVSRLLGAAGPLAVTPDGVEPARTADGIRVVSTDLLLEEDRPLRWRDPGREQFVWRGALEQGVLREFLSDVIWGQLDLLLVDLPPGSDGVTDLHELVPELGGVIAVTIPSDESRSSVARSLQAAVDAGIPVLGVVENMSGYHCAGCDTSRPLFPGHAGAELAEAFRVPVLARLAFQPEGGHVEADELEAAVAACFGKVS
jgi:ATP-binding protein involved in chromosome partitioning